MRQPDDWCEADIEIIRRTETINDIESEIQCMESCLAQGFTLKDYIDCQKQLIEILNSL